MSRDNALPMPSCQDCESIGLSVPQLLVEMEEAIGADATTAFLADYGGRELVISVTGLAPAHQAAVAWLHRTIGFGKYLVPLGPSAARSRIAWAIYLRLRDDQSLRMVATALNLGLRTVSRHKARLTRLGLLPPAKDPAR